MAPADRVEPRHRRSARPRRPGAAAADRARPAQAFPGQGRARQVGAGGRRRLVHRAQGRDPGHRRRIRLRQVDPRAAAAAPCRPRCRRTGVRRRRGRRAGRHRRQRAAPAGADGVPGFLFLAQPAHAGPRFGRRSARSSRAAKSPRRATSPATSSARSGSTRISSARAIRTSCRAGRSSASTSPARSPPARAW